jgi:DNA-binding CsgD family transcriptional regulator
MDIAILGKFSAIFSRATNANDLCRQIVHDDHLGNGLVGSQLFALSDRGVFHQVGTYGLEAFDSSEPLSQFAENPLAEAVDKRSIWRGELNLPASSDTGSIVAGPLALDVLPLTKDELPIGAISALARGDSDRVQIQDEEIIRVLANIGGLYLEGLGIRNLFRETPAQGNELSERQYEILLGLARGETNGEIAKQLILSESSIKQETVRIYRALGVGTREQAVAKARATGLIPDGIYPPPPPLGRSSSVGRPEGGSGVSSFSELTRPMGR